MYSLDVNFLNDRVERATEVGPAVARRSPDGTTPLYVGLGVGVFLVALVGGLGLFWWNENQRLQQRSAQLDQELIEIQGLLSQVGDINTRITQIEAQNQALATVFDRIKPWSAVLQDMRDRTPSGVQIGQILQVAPSPAPAPPPPPPASPAPGQPAQPVAPPPPPEPPASKVQVNGIARTFDDVNDFMLTLQRSPFLDAESTYLVSATLVPDPTEVEVAQPEGGGQQVQAELRPVVQYQIETTLSPIPTSDLLQDLERTLSVGLASRIQALRDKGVIQQ
ncbi:MAG: fimbrial assembly protein [Leptolyngbyaceae cyanobacterium SL_7_1]|nr:fimbrial assembly protein [Leptolyngbyaceae cyanobacterium SL_7_1]